MDIPVELAIGGIIAVGVVFFALHWARGRRRSNAVVAWAKENGWTYRENDRALVAGFRGAPFDGGVTHAARHAVSGTYRGRTVAVFKYDYTVPGEGASKQTSTPYEIVAVRLPGPTPGLQVAPEHVGHKLLNFVGAQDLQTGDAEFDAAFHITTDDEAFALEALGPALRRLHLDGPRTLPFRLTGGHILTWEQRKGAVDVPTGLAMADHLIDLAEQMPGHLFGPATERSAD
ncbi:hypothetical protein CLV63_11124 [Murinocardiopsis flavida]|uniref:DUF3137 domain-containing protein n=1 Tax=Murinocardiopsis flavida TaxID=645275 RepID=A0A2P8DGT3_9ACTN|nr:hypothetical protein [Murinocardiopsis flavida]PSK96430.1 hypothetical protein CLV63_11124 [Murinocardiopsis flavida]